MTTIMVRQNLRTRIKQHEGYRPVPYRDSEGNMTIGYGHKITPDEVATLTHLTVDEASALFTKDFLVALESAEKEFASCWGRMGPARQGVLLEMIFQMGRRGVAGFKGMRRALDKGDYRKAAAEMVDSLWAEQTTDRALRLVKVMLRGRE